MSALIEKNNNECLIHFAGTKDSLCPFSKKRFETFLCRREEWLQFEEAASVIAKNSLQVCRRDESSENCEQYFFHQKCYNSFTDISKIKRARQQQKVVNYDAEKEKSREEVEEPQSPKPKRRSRVSGQQGQGSNRNVLPDVCIICKRKISYIRDKKSRKTTRDKMHQAETIDCGRLREAAERKKDEAILIHIRGKDCVAIEVKYHNRCYHTYTKFLSNDARAKAENVHERSYNLFCKEVIEEKILGKHKVYYLTKLCDKFLSYLSKEQASESIYRTSKLKIKLQRDYPQLVFFSPSRQNKSELVYCEYIETGEVLGKMEFESVNCESASDLEPDDEEMTGEMPQEVSQRNDEFAKLYAIALLLRSCIQETATFPRVWPPTSVDISNDAAKDITPIVLFNFIAWVMNKSDEPTLDSFVRLQKSEERKVLSVAQDMIYITHNGRKPTPKSVALSMAVRQISGCSSIIDILNGFGHCASHSSTLRHDTALAKMNIKTGNSVPKEILPNRHTILVWDNDDFGEEAKVSTHITNGIAIQEEREDDVIPNVNVPKSQAKSLPTPHSEILPYVIGKKKSPNLKSICCSSDLEEKVYVAVQQFAEKCDFAYALIKMHYGGCLPDWTGFNTLLAEDKIPRVSKIGYLPVIDASPTEYSTVHTVLSKSKDIASQLGMDYMVLVFDEAIYSKAQHIRWKNPEFMEKFIIRMGDFHAIMSFCGAIGKLFRDAGLQDILIESGVVGTGSVNGVMSGKFYNGSTRCHKIMHEALERIRFQVFMDSLSPEERKDIEDQISILKDSFPCHDFENLLERPAFHDIMTQYGVFNETQKKTCPTFSLWSSYIDISGLMMKFIRATRESDWFLHLSTLRSMLPWYFAADRVNYSRYASVYWLEMNALEETHPSAAENLKRHWTVQRQQRYGFSSIACDQAIEQTANRDSKTKGGLIGFTLNKGAVNRWILSQSEQSAITRQCQIMAGAVDNERQRKNLDETHKQNYEKEVKSVISTIESMVNPFDKEQTNLIHLATGVIAPCAVQHDLLCAKSLGEKRFMQFVGENLLSDTPDLFDTIKKTKLQTFSSSQKPTKTATSKGKEVSLKSSRNLCARLLLLAKSRDVDMRIVLSYSLGPYPLSLATVDGNPTKTVKANLMHMLEEMSPECVNHFLPRNSAIMVDAMALLQSLTRIPKTFGELAVHVLSRLLSLAGFHKASRIDFVADRYPDHSIKANERSRRAAHGSTLVNIYGKSQPAPTQWKKYLNSGKNKEAFISFLIDCWKDLKSDDLTGLILYATRGDKCFKISPTSQSTIVETTEVVELECDHEEADTRLLLHAKHASDNDFSVVAIKSPDTDVFLLMVAMKQNFSADLHFITGNQNQSRIISVNEVCDKVGSETCNLIVGFHAFTGCDSVSSFYGKGEKKAWKVLSENPKGKDAFRILGNEVYPTEDLYEILVEFVCALYGHKDMTCVNEVRYCMFRLGSFSDECLPPTRDCLKKHVQRANYQAFIWKRCLLALIVTPSPAGRGWELKDEELTIHWMTSNVAPDQLLEFVNCGCKKGCSTQRCSCLKAGLRCTELCKCQNCVNTVPDNNSDDEEYLYDDFTEYLASDVESEDV